MTLAAGIALLTASAFLRPISPGALPSAPHELFAITPPVLDDLVIDAGQHIELDWSAAGRVARGFAALPDMSNAPAH